jgi:hypothetical protein
MRLLSLSRRWTLSAESVVHHLLASVCASHPLKNLKYHQRQLVDSFRSSLPVTCVELLESHQRELVDCSDPAYEPSIYAKVLFNVEKRLDLNNPPTAVGGILWTSPVHLRRLDLNHPPTPVGGIFDFFCKVSCSRSFQGHARGALP